MPGGGRCGHPGWSARLGGEDGPGVRVPGGKGCGHPGWSAGLHGGSGCPGFEVRVPGGHGFGVVVGKWKKLVDFVEGKVEMDGGKARST